jgi:hypothetical protein
MRAQIPTRYITLCHSHKGCQLVVFVRRAAGFAHLCKNTFVFEDFAFKPWVKISSGVKQLGIDAAKGRNRFKTSCLENEQGKNMDDQSSFW